MAIIKAISSRAEIGQAIDYITKEEKTDKKLISGIDCDPTNAKEVMELTKRLWKKTGGRTYKHYIQSYHANEHITLEQAHRNALELAKGTKAWEGFEILLATHKDKDHIHTHFIVNSVNLYTGYKLQWSKADLQDLKNRCNEQSIEQGLHVSEKGKTFEGEERTETVAWNKDTYQLLKKAEKQEADSYLQNIALAVLDCMELAINRTDFIEKLRERGIDVMWSDTRKYITFTDMDRLDRGEKKCRVRNNRLEKYYNIPFGKEDLERGFERNTRELQTEQFAREQIRTDTTAVTKDFRIGRADIGAFLDQLNSDERVAEEKRADSQAERDRREMAYERLDPERERTVESRERKIGTRKQGNPSKYGAGTRKDKPTSFRSR